MIFFFLLDDTYKYYTLAQDSSVIIATDSCIIMIHINDMSLECSRQTYQCTTVLDRHPARMTDRQTDKEKRLKLKAPPLTSASLVKSWNNLVH